MMLLVLLLLSVMCVISDNDNCHSGGACCLPDSVLALSKLCLIFFSHEPFVEGIDSTFLEGHPAQKS